MSAQPKRYEGAELEPLLEQVHRDLGPEAQIVAAEKVRNGGYLGFFAREGYRLEVSPPEGGRDTAPTVHGPAQAPTVPASPPQIHAPVPVATVTPATTTEAPVPTAGAAAPADDAPLRTAASVPPGTTEAQPTDPFVALAAQADDVIEWANAVAPRPTQVATGGDGEARRASEPDGAAADTTAADTTGADTTGARSNARPSAAMARIAQALSKAAALPARDLGAHDDAEEFAAVLRQVVASGAVPSPADTASVAPVLAGIGTGPRRGSHDAGHDAGLGLDAPAPDPTELDDQLDEIARFLAEQSTADAPRLDAGALATTLRRIGLSDETSREVAGAVGGGGDLGHVLLDLFSLLPEASPLPHLPGSLLVVVGTGERAFDLGALFAAEIDIDPDAVYLASSSAGLRRRLPVSRCVRSTEEAAERAPGWRRNAVAVVAVDAPIAGNATSWARHVIDTLRPTAVWGAVDAVCKAEDVAAWADALGGIDALVLDNVDATTSPLAVTTTGIAVARVCGQRSTPARWATLVMERVQ